MCKATQCFDRPSLSQNKRCPAKRSAPTCTPSTTLPMLRPSPPKKRCQIVSQKQTCIGLSQHLVSCSRPYAILKTRLSTRASQPTPLKTTKLSHPSHNVWRWMPTMYIKRVNPVCLTLVPCDLPPSIRQRNRDCFQRHLSGSCPLKGLFGRDLQLLPP